MNLLKKYPGLLELAYLQEADRTEILRSIFKRDIEDNPDFKFRGVAIYPIRDEQPAMQTLFNHLTKEEIEEEDEHGKRVKRREFDMHRSVRLHWIRYHIEENKKDSMDIFSAEERVKGRTVIRTYIYDVKEKYIIVLEPQRHRGYYLLTAYYLNREYGIDQLKRKIKNKLREVH